MTALQLALSELKRMTTGFLPKLAIIALSIVPLLYGAAYLYANWDPQSRMSNLQAALVVEDHGAVDEDGKKVNLGAEVAESLHESGSFTWVDVNSMEEAEKGVMSGEYAFAVRIPNTFSSSLLSVGNIMPGDEDKEAVQGLLEVVTNDANNYMINTFVDRLVVEVHNSVAKQVGTATADKFLTSFGVIHTKMLDAANGANTLHDGSTKLKNGSAELQTGAKKLKDGAAKLDTGIGDLQAGQKKLQAGAGQLEDGSKKLQDGSGKLENGARNLETGTKKLAAGATGLHSGTSELSAGLGSMEQQTRTLVGDSQKLADGSEQVAAGTEQLNTKVQKAISLAKQAHVDARTVLVEETNKLVADGVLTQQQADDIIKRHDQRQKDALHVKVRADLNKASKDVQALADGSRKVADGNRKLANSTPKLRQGIVDANAGSKKLNNGAAQLETGVTSAHAGATQLHSGATQMHTGATDLHSGATQLKSGLDQSLAGVTKLKAGSSQLRTGSSDLYDGSEQLARGAKDLDDGAARLTKALRDGADRIPHVSDQKKQNVTSVIGDPVAISKISQAKASTYGAGLAPFFLSLALWVGIFMLVQAMRPITQRALASNARSWRIALGGWIPFWLVAMAQATFLFLMVHFALGLEPASLPLTFLFMLLATMAFSAIIQGTVALLGTVGKFVVLVLLVLQLISAGGTLPWQLTPQPLHVVHDILPMSHVVEGLRRLIYGSDMASVSTNAWMLVGYTAVGLCLSIVAAHRNKTWRLKVLQPEIKI